MATFVRDFFLFSHNMIKSFDHYTGGYSRKIDYYTGGYQFRWVTKRLLSMAGVDLPAAYLTEGFTAAVAERYTNLSSGTPPLGEPGSNPLNLVEKVNELELQKNLNYQSEEFSFVLQDVAIHVLDHCDFQSFLSFSKTSKYFNKLCREHVFPFNVRAQILKFSLRKISYFSYLRDGHWIDIWNVARKALIIGAPIYFGYKFLSKLAIKNGLRATNPEYFMKEMRYVCDSEGSCSNRLVEICTHPRVSGMELFGVGAFFVAPISAFYTRDDWTRFHPASIQLVGIKQDFQYEPSAIIRFISPDFAKWRLDKLRKNISAPRDWTRDPVLRQSVCALSRDLAMFPVVDQCGHTFDYLTISTYMNSHRTVRCPLKEGENENLLHLKFDEAKFNELKTRIEEVFD